MTSIGYAAFKGCNKLTSVNIPKSVTNIGGSAFEGCLNLSSVNIPVGVTSIGYYTFYGCSGLKNLIIEDGESTLSLGYNEYNSSGTGKGLFYDCPLETLYLGRNLSYNNDKKYGYSPFYDKTSLTSVTIGNSVTSIGNYAFSGCSGLTSIAIPSSVTSIGESAFSGCSRLTKAEFASIEHYLNGISFDGGSGSPANPLLYAHHLYIGGNEFTDLVIPNSMTSISDYLFRGCYSLTSVSIPNSVTSIGEDAFSACGGLTKAEFASIESLCGIHFSNSGSNPLRSAQHLYIGGSEVTELVIPSNISSIGQNALACPNFLPVYCFREEPPSAYDSTFPPNAYTWADLYVPIGCKTKYQSAEGWKNFQYIYEFDVTPVTAIKDEDKEHGATYDLNGRKVKRPTKGVYIHNGRKTVVR